MKPATHAILFVDDEIEILSALKRTMRSFPYPCLYANSGKKAISLLAAQPVAVLISDMRMPEMSGPQLLKYARLHYPKTIRLVLSGYSDSSDILSAVNRGHIYRYIVKPWDNGVLKTIVRQAMELFELQWEKERLQRQLEAQNELLEQKVESRTQQLIKISAHAEIGKYASQIVHNLKNPLQVLFGTLGLSKKILPKNDHNDPDRLVKYIDMALDSAKSLQQIVAGILMHARDDNHQRPMPININEIIRHELDFFDIDTAFKDQIDKKVALDEHLPEVLGNSVQIKQIVDNLIRNAVDAMEASFPKQLRINTFSRDGHVVLTIGDSGKGISSTDMPYIFNPDFSTKPMDKGTGLGLASVQTMVAAYGGDISVVSNEGQGTTFTVTFPAHGFIKAAIQNN